MSDNQGEEEYTFTMVYLYITLLRLPLKEIQ